MNKLEISIEVNVNLSEATQQFITTLVNGSIAHTEETTHEEPSQVEDRKPKPRKPQSKEEPKPETKEEPKPEPKEEPKPEPKEEPKPEPKEEPKPEPKEEPKPQPTATKVTLETLRGKLREAITKDKNKMTPISNKLKEFGSDSLTRLDKSHYEEMDKFLDEIQEA